MEIPEALRRLSGDPKGRRWLEALPTLVSELSEVWGLEVGPVFQGSFVSLVAPAVREGEAVVLKIQWPHPEADGEAEALRVWDGDGAVRLLARDEARHALLLEPCVPGTHLTELGAGALDVLVGLLPRLWKPAGSGFRTLADEAAGWRRNLWAGWEATGRSCDRRLVEAAEEYLKELPHSQGEQVLVHQDLHDENVLAAEREPWLVIDPKPLVGEREFSVAPIVRAFGLGDSESALLGRLDRLCGDLGLDREQARGWTVAQTMAWSWESPRRAEYHRAVGWLLAS